jgi:hypothetical protein
LLQPYLQEYRAQKRQERPVDQEKLDQLALPSLEVFYEVMGDEALRFWKRLAAQLS